MRSPLTFKTIYRLDYDLSYGLLDFLGQFSQILKTKMYSKPFLESNTGLDLINHAFSATGKLEGDDVVRVTLSLTTLNAVIEHGQGRELSSLHSHPGIELIDPILEKFGEFDKIGEQNIIKYNRIGFRTFIIFSEDLEFDVIKNYISGITNPICTPLLSNFESIDDLALTYETKQNKNDHRCTVTLGPYKMGQAKKYFSIEPNVQEGLLLDIDVYQNNVEAPFGKTSTFSRMSKYYFDTINELARSINENLIVELNK